MNRKITFTPGEYYHIYNRGVEKRNVFMDVRDRDRFQSLLYLLNGVKPIIYRLIQGETLYKEEVGEKIVAIGAYVLMPNHFHLLLKETKDGGVTSFIRKLTTGYTMYFNKKYERVGPLFQGAFKAEHINNDGYLKYLFAYIHLNPVKLIDKNWKEKGITNLKHAERFLQEYLHSSYSDYLRIQRLEKDILSPKLFPNYFSNSQTVTTFHKDLLKFNPPHNTR